MDVVKPVRVSHSYTQHNEAPPDEVFPLLCPVRECDWVAGWEPRRVISESGVAEEDCVFIMPGDPEAIWVVTRYEPPRRVGFVQVTPGEMVVRIEIELEPAEQGATAAHVTYTYTALEEHSAHIVHERTAAAYRAFMEEWERELNAYLRAQRL